MKCRLSRVCFVLLCLVGSSTTGQGPKPESATIPETATSSGWSIEQVALKPRANEYRERITFSEEFVLQPEPGQILVDVEWKMSAVVPDPMALDKLKKCHGTNSDFSKVKIETTTGQYRCFDMNGLRLVGPDDKQYKPLWIIEPSPALKILVKPNRQATLTAGKGPEFWHETCQSNGDEYHGLVEIGHTTRMVAIFRVPKDIKLVELRLQFNDRQPGIDADKAEQEKREKAAVTKLKAAKTLLDKNKSAAKKRLEEIVGDYAGTAAAKEAENLLKKQ